MKTGWVQPRGGPTRVSWIPCCRLWRLMDVTPRGAVRPCWTGSSLRMGLIDAGRGFPSYRSGETSTCSSPPPLRPSTAQPIDWPRSIRYCRALSGPGRPLVNLPHPSRRLPLRQPGGGAGGVRSRCRVLLAAPHPWVLWIAGRWLTISLHNRGDARVPVTVLSLGCDRRRVTLHGGDHAKVPAARPVLWRT